MTGPALWTCRVATYDESGEARDLGRVVHEVPAPALFDALPERFTDDEVVLVVELWEETERLRWLRDEREVEAELADVLLDGRLEELLGSA